MVCFSQATIAASSDSSSRDLPPPIPPLRCITFSTSPRSAEQWIVAENCRPRSRQYLLPGHSSAYKVLRAADKSLPDADDASKTPVKNQFTPGLDLVWTPLSSVAIDHRKGQGCIGY